MYKVYCNDELIYNPNIKELCFASANLELELSNAGGFTFSITKEHPFYGTIDKHKSYIRVYNDDELLFAGRAINEYLDYFGNNKVICEGELAYFNDSIQRPAELHDITVRGFLELIVDNHNSQVEADKRFTVGNVTVTDANDSLYRYLNYENSLTVIKEKLVDKLGGFVAIRHQNGTRYIDYLAEAINTTRQTIEFGKNLLDFAKNMDASDICTRLIPLGRKLDESSYTAIDERLTIKSVNNDVDYIQSNDAISTYGIITKTKIWDDVSTASILKTKGQKYLESEQFEKMELQLTAVDMHLLDKDIDSISLGDQILAISKPHGLNKYFPVSKMSINLLDASNNKITLGTSVDVSISAKSNSIETVADNASTFSQSSILQSAKDNASSLIQTATNGYIVLVPDDNGNPKELLIMDTADVETATKVWRWNVNGLGYSKNGYNGTYGLAMTMDGAIVADFITSGTMYADRIKGGTLYLGGSNNSDGVLRIKNASGTEIGSWTKDGIKATNCDLDGKMKAGASNSYLMELDQGKLIGYYNGTKRGQIDVTAENNISGTVYHGVNIESNIVQFSKVKKMLIDSETIAVKSGSTYQATGSGQVNIPTGLNYGTITAISNIRIFKDYLGYMTDILYDENTYSFCTGFSGSVTLSFVKGLITVNIS